MRSEIRKSCWWPDITKREVLGGLLKVNLLVAVFGWLFYGEGIAILCLLVPGNLLGLRLWAKRLLREKGETFMETFREALVILADALKVGYALPNAIEETYRNLLLIYPKEERICREFKQMIREERLNKPMREILEGLSERIPEDDVASLVDVLVIAQKSGGNMVAIMERSIRQLCDKVRVKQEIEVLFASKELEFHILCAIPLGILFYLRFTMPAFTEILYHNLPGKIFMSICLLIYMGAFRAGERLVSVHV